MHSESSGVKTLDAPRSSESLLGASGRKCGEFARPPEDGDEFTKFRPCSGLGKPASKGSEAATTQKIKR
jgi:hypothetical protein